VDPRRGARRSISPRSPRRASPGPRVDETALRERCWQAYATHYGRQRVVGGLVSHLMGLVLCGMLARGGLHDHRPLRPTVLEIDLDAVRQRARGAGARRSRAQDLSPSSRPTATDSARRDGAVFVRNGADCLAVADLTEASGCVSVESPRDPRLSNSLPEAAADALAHDLVPPSWIRRRRAYSEAAVGPCEVFVKVDVGPRAPRVPTEQAVKTILAMMELRHLRLGGIWPIPTPRSAVIPRTPTGSSGDYGRRRRAGGAGVPGAREAPGRHALRCSASRTRISTPSIRPDALRITFPGDAAVPLRPTFRALTTRVDRAQSSRPRALCRARPSGDGAHATRSGAHGSADGLRWLHAGHVLVRGSVRPLIGSPSLEHTRIDLTGVPAASVGDEVVIIAARAGWRSRPPRSRLATASAPPRGDHGGPRVAGRAALYPCWCSRSVQSRPASRRSVRDAASGLVADPVSSPSSPRERAQSTAGSELSSLYTFCAMADT